MSHTINGSDKKMLPKDQVGSPSTDEGSSGGSVVGGGSGLKKGPWTSAEDAILVEYVKKHGEGNWNALQKHSGLYRCGKSCRLRWANHLRPNLKKGAFTTQEEQTIIELHARMGNKWARMAAHSECSSPRNSGLLEEVLHESHTMHTGKKLSCDKSSNSYVVTPSDLVDSSANNFCDGTAQEDCDPISPLGCSAAAVFNEYTPPINGSSLDDLPPSGSDIVLPSAEYVSTSNIAERDIKPKPDFLRPDALLGSVWLLESSQMAKDRTDMNNAIAALLGDDDFCSEHKPVRETSSTLTGILGLDSYPWNNMPRVCQMSELP